MPERIDYVHIYIVLIGKSATGKTLQFHVYAKRGKQFLGLISWFPRWRQYTFKPNALTVYSAGCLTDISSFVSQVNANHRKKLRDR